MADETDYGFGGYDLGGYDDSLGYDWQDWFDPSQWGVDTPYGSINENVDPSKTVVNKDGTTYFYDKNNNFLGGVGSSGQVITNTPGNQFASVLRNLFGGTGDLGALGQLGAFAGLAGLANQSNFFNPPAQKVGFQGVIPKYEYERQQTPLSVQRPEGYRPGQGGVTYFTPGQYYDVGYDPATAGEFLNTDTTLPSAPETTESQLASGGLAYADGGFTNEQIYNTYQGLLGQGMTHDQILAAAARNPNLNLNAGQINAALAQFQAPKFTDQQFLEAGRTALQQGLDPQTALQKAAEFGASQDQLNRLTGALGSSGIAGLTTPTTTLAYNPPANIPAPPSDYTNAYTQYEKKSTMPVTDRATADAGIAALPGAAATTTAAPLGALQSEIFGAFNKAQQTGNWSEFSRKAQEMNLGADELAALFPNLSAQGIAQFAKDKGFQLGTSPLAFSGRNIEQFLSGDQPAQGFTAQLLQMLGMQLTPEQMTNLRSKMAAASPISMRPFLAESLQAAVAKNDFSRINDILKKYDISQSELKSIFQSVNNPAIEEFVSRGLKFDALPDWLSTQRYIEDPNAATQIARAWKQAHGRDISPDELKTLSFQLGGQYPKTLNQVLEMVKPVDLSQTQSFKDAESRGERYIPSTMDILSAGLNDVVGIASNWDRYDWNKILNSKDPRAAVIATNRSIAKTINDGLIKDRPDLVTKIGDINGVPVLMQQLPKGQKQIVFNGADITDPNKLYEQFYKLGFGTDEMNKLADFADKSGVKYKPGERYAGSDAGVDLRDIARGGYGTTFNPFDYEHFKAQEASGPAWSRGSQTYYDTIHKGNYYADQLGLSLNRNLTNTIGYVPQLDSEIRPVLNKEGKPMNYAVRSGGGIRYFESAKEAAQAGKVIDLTGRSPTKTYTGDAYRSGERLVQPKELPEGYLYTPPKREQVSGTSTTPSKSTIPATPTVRPTSTVVPTSRPTSVAPTTPPPPVTQSGGISNIPTQYTQALMTALARAAAARRTTPTTASRTTAKQAGIGSLTPTTVLRRKPVGGAAGGDVTMLAKGRYLKGDGDGVSDSIDAKFVGSGQPAALADGEFVIPARVVSELGNGSSDAGARKLYAMLDRVEQRARKAKRGKPSGADRELNKLA